MHGPPPVAPLSSAPWVAFGVGACLLLPWLWPWAPGPSTAVVPWFAGAACGVWIALLTGAAVSRTLLLALVPLLPLAAWRAISPLEPAALGSAVVLVALAAGAGAWAVREGEVRIVARAWWIAAALSAAFALLQYFALAGPFAPWVSVTEAGTAYANLRQRNQFATLTAIGMAALLWETRGGARVAIMAPLAAWLAIGNAASGSRTGLVELLVLIALALAWPGRSRAQAVVAGTALGTYALAAAALPWLLLSLTGAEGVSLWERVSAPGACGSRSVLWSNVADLIRERPWVGWGWGELDFAHFSTLYAGPRFCDILDNAHDLPLHLAVEFGLPVAVLICGAVLYAALRARPWREMDSARQLAWSVVTLVAMHSLLEYPLWYSPFQIAVGVSIGMLWPQDARTLPAAGRWLLPAACAAALGYAAWDYLRVTQIYLAPEDRLAAYRDDTMARIRGSWLFREYAAFAALTTTPLTRANAQWTYDTARSMVHYSPEPRVVEKIVESATMLGHDDVAVGQLARFRAAFPKEHAEWARGQGLRD
jgi:O-antigen ligase